MKYAFIKVDIASPFPTHQMGHMVQTFDVSELKDSLFARIWAFQDGNQLIIHVSMDLLCFPEELRNELQKEARTFYQCDQLHLITSTTHTHYSHNILNQEYCKLLMERLKNGIHSLVFEDIETPMTSYTYMKSKAGGKSRITGYESDLEHLCLWRLYDGDQPLLTAIIYNAHPTTLAATSPFFSSEYPGYVLAKLEETYSDQDYTFMLGPAGDISSRFVREGQDYESMCKVAETVYTDVVKLLEKETEKVPLQLDYQEIILEYEHDYSEIDISNIREGLSERELETVQYGQKMRADLGKTTVTSRLNNPHATVGVLNTGSCKFVFYPNETFSWYMTFLKNLDHMVYCSCSNGYGAYILPIDFPFVTYEMFLDTLTRNTKEKLIALLQSI